MRKLFLFFTLFLFSANVTFADEYIYILSDTKLNKLYFDAINYFHDTKTTIHKDIRGIIIRFPLENILNEYEQITHKTLQNLEKIEYFLAKNKNPVIIEVHTAKFPLNNSSNLKNWEISTVIANRIETILLKNGRISRGKRRVSLDFSRILLYDIIV